MSQHEHQVLPQVGLVAMDEEHELLSMALRRLRSLCPEVDPSEVCTCSNARRCECVDFIADQLTELLDYVVRHFAHEERLMRMVADSEANFASCEAHKRDHAEISRALSEAAYSLTETTLKRSLRNLCDLIHAWIERHVRSHDVELAGMICKPISYPIG